MASSSDSPTGPSTERPSRFIVGPRGPREVPVANAGVPPAMPATPAGRIGGALAPTASAPQGQRPFAVEDDAGAGAERWSPAGAIQGPLTSGETQHLAGVAQATIADPVPLGLAGFAAATFTISSAFCGWFGVAAAVIAIPVALIYGGIGQFLAGMWAFRRGNVLAATAFATFGCFNAAWALLEWLALAHVLPTLGIASGPAYVEGIFVLMFALISAYLGVAALGENQMIAAILFVLAFTYLCDGTGVWIGGQNWLLTIGGYAGIIVSLMAFYESAAVVINSTMRREVLPTFPARAGTPFFLLGARPESSLRRDQDPRAPLLPNAPTPA